MKKRTQSPTIRKFLKLCCEKCGNTDKRVLTIHHKNRVCDGGNDFQENLQTLCANCHRIAHIESYQKEITKIEDGVEKKAYRFPVECFLCKEKTNKTWFSNAFYQHPLCKKCFRKKAREFLKPRNIRLEEEQEIKEWIEKLAYAKPVKKLTDSFVMDFPNKRRGDVFG